jgi:hypothetical protein
VIKSEPAGVFALSFSHTPVVSVRVPGIPELNMAPLEPLRIDQLHMENGVGNVRVRALFNNLTILGAGNYSVITVK